MKECKNNYIEENIYYYYYIFGWLLFVYWLLGLILNYFKININSWVLVASYKELINMYALTGGALLNIIIFRRTLDKF